MTEAGVHIIDVGGESTRPGAVPVDPAEEWSRIGPVLERLIERTAGRRLRPLLSLDTRYAEVAEKGLKLGVDVINDVGGLTSPDMIALAKGSGRDWVAMHHVTVPADPRVTLPPDRDPFDAVEQWLIARMEAWEAQGLDLERIIFDPGIGFGKNRLQSLRLLRRAGEFRRHGLRVLVGHSRKSFMKSFSGAGEDEARMEQTRSSPAGALGADVGDFTQRNRGATAPAVASHDDLTTLGASLNLCVQGVDVIRVHDVPLHTTAYRGWSHVAG